MDDPKPFRHEWTISGLGSVWGRITGHPHIKSRVNERLEFCFYPNGYDESCRKYVSLGVIKLFFAENEKNLHQINCKISIKNNKEEKLFVKELKIAENVKYLFRYIKQDYLLYPAYGLTDNYNDKFTLCFEGWLHKRGDIIQANIENKAELNRDYFDIRPLLSTKSLAFKWTIENVEDLFESKYFSIKLPLIIGITRFREEIFRPRIEMIKDSDNNKVLLFEVKSNYKGLIVIETSVIDLANQEKCYCSKKALESSLDGFIHEFIIDKKIYSSPSILTDNKLTLFCDITMITKSMKKENETKYLLMLESFEAPSAFQITECTIDGKTGEILKNKVVPLFSNLKREKLEREKLEQEKLEREKLEQEKQEREMQAIKKLKQLTNSITEQTSTIDQAITNVFNIVHHEHYFEKSSLNGVLVNTKSQSNFGDINIKTSEHIDHVPLIEKLETIVSSEIKPILDKNEQTFTEMKTLKLPNNIDLVGMVLSNQKLILENKEEMKALQIEHHNLKQSKNVEQSIMKQIVDRVILFLTRIKYELNKVVINISSTVAQSKSFQPPKTTLEKSNFLSDRIEFQIAPLVKWMEYIPTSSSISSETKQSHIHKLDTVKEFLIENLPVENLSVNE